ncbi:MAG: hypothetical protein LYZ66_07260 [Nitrososphaerales archaeon]|nr:hypothetical protein [Nitrososphaerales archaeon]
MGAFTGTLLTAVLAWFHVISAVAWLGGGIMFAVVIGPALVKLSPSSSGEFLAKVAPKVGRFFQIIAGSTILFGVLLVYNLGGFELLSLSSFYGVVITIGLSLGFTAFLTSEFVAVPSLLKVARMIREMQASGQDQPPAEFPKTLRRATITAYLTVLLLILTSVFMVAAGFY